MNKLIFTLPNLTESSGTFSLPWEFKFEANNIPENIRKVKADRQEWYKNPATRHCFYSGFVGRSELMRVGKDNPPKELRLLSADYDCQIPHERLLEAIEMMPVKPTFIEQSLGGNCRLVWQYETPTLLASNEFAYFYQTKAMEWLRLNLLPMLDEPAWLKASRLYCCGDKWEATGYGPVPAKETQAFFVTVAKEFRSKECSDTAIGLDVVEAELRKKYPEFSKWPGEFCLGAQGPSFWVADSQSTSSAIVKTDGIFTFAAHAEKSFYSWSDLLGAEFTADYQKSNVAKATADIWFDGNRYHRKIEDRYVSMKPAEFLNYLTTDCSLSEKKDKSGKSPIQNALSHVYNCQRVTGAAPFVPLPQGVHIFMGTRHLNTYSGKPIHPVVGTQHWGRMGNFPFISALFSGFYDPLDQLDDYFAWGQYYYVGVLEGVCRPGPAMYLGGQPGCGKTLASRNIWGPAVGGFADAAQFVLNGDKFNSHLLGVPHWSLDDDTTSSNEYLANQAHMMIKKIISNDTFEFSQKYEVSSMTKWGGRLHFSFNLDEKSVRIVGTLEEAMLKKISLLRCANVIGGRADGFKFPARAQIAALIEKELPYFLRWLVDHKVPDHVKPDVERYGWEARHEESLFERARGSSPSGPFKEIILEALTGWFRDNPEEKEFRNTTTQLLKQVTCHCADSSIIRMTKPEKIVEYIQNLAADKFMDCRSETDPKHNIRFWIFQRPV